ncbi:MAG TPA: hemerythrin domain-containing protein [Acidimicrobiia bacterium]|jgi:hemerythrin-like domain-containing protein|nr:hemerythrin domain-containing protein [Acidimicrobiia bacterium]
MINTDTATGDLRDDHQLILTVLGALDGILSAETPHTTLDFEGLRDCITFFRLFTDACHHGKEEDLLFPRLTERGLSGEAGPITAMLEDHRMGRAYVGQMADSIDEAEAGDIGATSVLREAALSYLDLLRAHIGKEDYALFPMADEMVTGSACRTLCEDYALVCTRRFEGRTEDELKNLASSLADRYPAFG